MKSRKYSWSKLLGLLMKMHSLQNVKTFKNLIKKKL